VATNYPENLDTDAIIGGGSKPASDDALDSSVGQPTHAGMHQNLGDAILEIETKLGTGDSSPSANKVLVSSGTASTWGEVATDMIADDAITSAKIDDGAVGNDQLIDAPTFTTVTATDITLDGRDLGEIQTYTPTWTNVSGDFQSVGAYFAYVKDMVYMSIEAELSGDTSVDGSVYVSLPVTGSDSHQAANGMLQVQLFDWDANRFYQGMTTPIDTTTVAIRYNIVDGNEIFGQPVGPSAPFGWGDNDKILITGFYRAGS